jgi:hypothetical protein
VVIIVVVDQQLKAGDGNLSRIKNPLPSRTSGVVELSRIGCDHTHFLVRRPGLEPGTC